MSGSLTCLTTSGHTKVSTLLLPEAGFVSLLPDEVIEAIAKARAAGGEHSRALHLVSYSVDELRSARKADSEARVSAAREGKPDPGCAIEERTAEAIQKARMDEPVLRALASDAHVKLVQAIRSSPSLAEDLAKKTVACTRRLAESLDQAERAAAERERLRMALAWVNAVIADQRPPRVGEGGLAARVSRYSQAVGYARASLGDHGPEEAVRRYPLNGAKEYLKPTQATEESTMEAVASG